MTLALVVARSESLGYEFPDQVNPADFMMDIIGGDVHCERDPTLKHTDLPQKWIDDTTFSQREPSAAAADAGGDLADPKNREGATFEEQFKLFAKRALKQQFRPFSAFVTDCVLIYGAGACLGLAQKNTALLQLPMSSALPAIAVGLTTIISSTRNFGNERVVYWREAASGLNRVAYFLAKNVADIPRLLLIPIFYFIMVRPMAGLKHHRVRVSHPPGGSLSSRACSTTTTRARECTCWARTPSCCSRCGPSAACKFSTSSCALACGA